MNYSMAECALFGALDHGQILPWNSKRLTSTLLTKIAKGMQLPTGGSIEDTRVVVEGYLREQHKDPASIQVRVLERQIDLLDAEGVFFTAREEEEKFSDFEEVARESSVRHELEWYEQELSSAKAHNEDLVMQLHDRQAELESGKSRIQELWAMNCSQLVAFDKALSEKDAEIARLMSRITEFEGEERDSSPGSGYTSISLRDISPGSSHNSVSSKGSLHVERGTPELASKPRRGKAPPVSKFTGENIECQLDEWLPSLERASVWNDWTEQEKLLQLAGHLDGRALQEWNLMKAEDKVRFGKAVDVLRNRIDPANKSAAAQDFRHTSQRESETVSDFIRRLERMFRVAYGRDDMSSETRDTLLYCQLQEGLRYELMKAPAVSGSSQYLELCTAAKNKEKRLADLKKRQQYATGRQHGNSKPKPVSEQKFSPNNGAGHGGKPWVEQRRCFYCKKVGHMIDECHRRKSAERNRATQNKPGAKQVKSSEEVEVDSKPSTEAEASQQSNVEEEVNLMEELPTDLMDLMYSSSGEEVREIRVSDEGSRSHYARVLINGVPVEGIVDTGADITIIGRDLFAKVAAAARLRKKAFRKPDKVPRTYDQRTFRLDGCIDLNISYEDKVLTTTVYVKMDAAEPLLLSEGVCRQWDTDLPSCSQEGEV